MDVVIADANFEDPVYVDIISGNIYDIPESAVEKKGGTFTFKNIPVYDSPVLIADKSLIPLIKK